MPTPMIHWMPMAEFMAMQAMEDAYARYGAALSARDIAAFDDIHSADYRWIKLDSTVADRDHAIQEMVSLLDSTPEPIQFHERLVAVTASDNRMQVRAVKELRVGDTDFSTDDVEETWRLENGKWRLVETRVCGG